MKRFVAIGIMLLLAVLVVADEVPLPGGFPAHAGPSGWFPMGAFPVAGSSSPSTPVPPGSAAARIVTLLGAGALMLFLLLGGILWATLRNGAILTAILTEIREERRIDPPELLEAKDELDRYLSGRPDPPRLT